MKKILLLIYLLIVLLLSFYLTFNNKLVVFSSQNIDGIKDKTLVIALKNKDLNIGDQILYYNFYTTKSKILSGNIIFYEKTNQNKLTYELDTNRFVSEDYVISSVNKTIKVPLIGSIFIFLTSTWGYLIFALIPSLLLFSYYLYNFIYGVKDEK